MSGQTAQLTQTVRTVQQWLVENHQDLPSSCGTGACDGVMGPETGAVLRFLLKDEYGGRVTATYKDGGNRVVFWGPASDLDALQAWIRADAAAFTPQRRSSGARSLLLTDPQAPAVGSSFSMPTWGWALVGLGVVGAGVVAYQTWGK